MLPADRREVGEQQIRHRFAAMAECIQRAAEVDRVPERDGGGDQRQPAGPVLLCRGGAVAQAAEPVEADGPARALRASPLFSSAVAWRRSAGISSQSSMNSVRSTRPISRSARASPFCLG